MRFWTAAIVVLAATQASAQTAAEASGNAAIAARDVFRSRCARCHGPNLQRPSGRFGYVLDLRRPVYAIRPGAQGDITLPANKSSTQSIAWCQRAAAPYNPSMLAYRDRLYVVYDKGFLACFDAGSGDVMYDRQRIPNGRAFTSSPWAYGGRVFCLNEYGETFVFAAGDEFVPLHTNTLAEDDMCMASPAIVGDRLLIRTAARIYSFKNGAGK